MAFAFPSATTVGQLYTYGATTWEWDGTVWNVQPSFGDIKMSITADNEIDTKTLDLILDSATGETQIDDNLTVTGTLDVTGITTFTTDVSVGGTLYTGNISTQSGSLSITSNTGSVDLTASVNLQGDIFPVGTHNLGSQATPFDGVYANTAYTGAIEAQSGSLSMTSNSGFVNVNAAMSIEGNINAMDADSYDIGSAGTRWQTIYGNAFDGVTNNVSGLSTLSNVVPDADNAKDLGSSAATWKDVYANKVMLGDLTIDGSNNTISSSTNSIVIDPAPSGDGGDVTIAGNILITGSTTGGTSTLGNVTITGDLTVNGTTTTVNSTTVTLDDPVMTLGGDTPAGSDDGLDRGIEFRWHDGSADKVGFFGWDRSAQKFSFMPDATNTGEVFSGALGNVAFGGADFTGNVVPSADVTYDLGSSSAKWNHGYFDTLTVDNFNATPQFGNVQIAVTDDQTIDTTSGDLNLYADSQAVRTSGTFYAEEIQASGNFSVAGTETTINDLHLGGSGFRSAFVSTKSGATVGDIRFTYDRTSVSHAYMQIFSNGRMQLNGAGNQLTIQNYNSTTDAAGIIEIGTGGFVGADDSNYCSGFNVWAEDTQIKNVLPHDDVTWDLGSAAKKWNNGHFENLFATNMTVPSVTFGNVQIAVLDDQTIDTAAGDLLLASATGIVNINGIGANVNAPLTVSQAFTANGGATVSGATTLNATLGVTGATTLSDTLAVTNGTTVGGTLGVIGLSSLAGVAADTINPNADLTHDLGGAALRWNALYAKTINMIDPATPGTNVELSVVSNDLYVDGVKVGGSATVDTTAPSDPDEGMFWMDRNSGILYIWVVNASTGNGNWIQPL